MTLPADPMPAVVVDGAAVPVRPWSTWRDAATAHDPALTGALRKGEAWLADARGEALDPGGAVVPGARIRVVRTVPERAERP